MKFNNTHGFCQPGDNSDELQDFPRPRKRNQMKAFVAADNAIGEVFGVQYADKEQLVFAPNRLGILFLNILLSK
ncbi:hypothetical protein [Hymenobacter negativus]|uniref:Uncharacterized protein n=1 Tax=Hymenobacter negativus TaxID=2795026 RepID=A0ABS3QJY9_9BACT|nr:hypothetical protein [Hymenobacter negativus]MBO2011467.1 hypothetical protein [Hymenobacter negativus]